MQIINSPEVDFEKGFMVYREIPSYHDTFFAIPRGLSKKEYKDLLKENQKKIDECLAKVREVGMEQGIFWDLSREEYIIRKKKLNALIKSHEEWGEDQVEKANSYPITNLIEFKRGFAQCLWHQEKTGSLKLYEKDNKVHCFGCNKSYDSIDAYMKINNVTFNQAIKNLTR